MRNGYARLFPAPLLAGGVIAATVCAAALAGCSAGDGGGPAAAPPPAQVQVIGPHRQPAVVLTPAGASRIGLQTARSVRDKNGLTAFPYSALLYEPDGQAAVYVSNGRLTFVRHFVDVDHIDGGEVYVRAGVQPGARVVTDGSEELLGVQNGVGEQT
jgi:hypothetical protein